MKKKEILIIIVLAFLVTGGSSLVCRHSELITFTFRDTLCGFPLPLFIKKEYFQPVVVEVKPQIIFPVVGVDFFFWFLILLIGWWVFKKFKKPRK